MLNNFLGLYSKSLSDAHPHCVHAEGEGERKLIPLYQRRNEPDRRTEVRGKSTKLQTAIPAVV